MTDEHAPSNNVSQNAASQPDPVPLAYNSPKGREHVAKILANAKPTAIVPHDYQLDGICKLLDGEDVIATMATGEGKTGFHVFFMITVREIGKQPQLALDGRGFPKNPCMVFVIPTKALQKDMSRVVSSKEHRRRQNRRRFQPSEIRSVGREVAGGRGV